MRRVSRWERSAESVTEDFGPECVVWEERTATLHHLDAAGTLVWRCLGTAGSDDEVSARVLDRLGDDAPGEDVVRRDVHDFLVALSRKSLTVMGR